MSLAANPFIRLWEAPVETLTLTGYALGLTCLVFVTLAACYRNGLTIITHWEHKRPQDWEYVPPAGWLLRVAAIPLVLMLDVWAVAAIIWLLT